MHAFPRACGGTNANIPSGNVSPAHQQARLPAHALMPPQIGQTASLGAPPIGSLIASFIRPRPSPEHRASDRKRRTAIIARLPASFQARGYSDPG